jgi:hypothetical protein
MRQRRVTKKAMRQRCLNTVTYKLINEPGTCSISNYARAMLGERGQGKNKEEQKVDVDEESAILPKPI